MSIACAIFSAIINTRSFPSWAKDSEYEWSGVLKNQPYHGNAYANPDAKYAHHLWYPILCNNVNCTAIKAVHSSVLANIKPTIK